MNHSRAAFILCAHNNRELLGACLESIAAQTYRDFECIVVDDASRDGTDELVRQRYPSVCLIRQDTNLGPSIARNQAANATVAPILAFLDSDVELDPHWLERTLPALERDATVGIVGGKVILHSHRELLDSYGGILSPIGLGWNACEGSAAEYVDPPVERLWVPSCAMLMRHELFDRLGGFDAAFFYGYEDADIGWRARLVGYRCLCVPEALVYHRVSETVTRMGDRIVFHYCKNRLRALLKNYGTGRLLCYLPIYLSYVALDLLSRPQRAAKVQALWWSLRHLPDTIRLRRVVQRARRVSDREFRHLFSPHWLPDTPLKRRKAFARKEQPWFRSTQSPA